MFQKTETTVTQNHFALNYADYIYGAEKAFWDLAHLVGKMLLTTFSTVLLVIFYFFILAFMTGAGEPHLKIEP